MKPRYRPRVLCGAVLLLGAFVPGAATAGEEAPGPGGALCGFTSVTDPGTEGGDVQTGEIDGGPLLASGTLTCSIQVGVESHSGSNAASSSASGSVAVVLPPTIVSFVAPEGIPVYLCTQWTDGNGTVYWHEDWADPTLSHWSADPSTPCGLTTSASAPDGTGVGGEGNVNRPVPRPRPGGGGNPPTPIYPRGMIRIWREVGGGVHTFADPASFNPPLWQWSCGNGVTLTSYQCTPPPPASTQYYNVCGTVTVVVDNDTLGDVTGRSACASGLFAQATTTAVNRHGSGSASPHGAFAWRCEVDESLLASAGPWTVDCSVG